MTEDEARTKWCPFSRVAMWEPIGNDPARNQPAVNRHDNTITCLASACMVWRTETVFDNDNPRGRPDGFCGLARKDT